MAAQRSVLIVDRSEETREVLRTVLERRGLRIFATGRAQRGLELARQHQPDLIVLDTELDASGPEGISRPLVEQSRRQQTPLVILGTVRQDLGGLEAGQFLAKPYHYAQLVRKIEELLSEHQHSLARSA